MLMLSKMIIDRPVMSLRTGRPVATANQPIINPNNLKIEGFYCTDSVEPKKQLVLLTQDIREVLPVGLVINDHEVLAEPEDLIRLQKTMQLQFNVLGKQVVTENKQKLGKVSDFAIEPSSMMIKKIYVSQSLMKSLTGGSLGIDRNQIIEVTNRKIVVKELLQKVPDQVPALSPSPAS